jgi:hypothetical protein
MKSSKRLILFQSLISSHLLLLPISIQRPMETKIRCKKSERLLRTRLDLRDSALFLLIEKMRPKP